MDMKKFQGVVVPIINPCSERDGVDEDALMRFCAHLLKAPIHGLYINGGTGDGGSLTQQERERTAELLLPEMKKQGKCAIVHVGQTTARQAVALAEHAMKNGADAVASIPPRKGWDQIVQYYRALAATGAPVFVYYIPGVTGMTAGMNEMKRLLDIPGVAGLKLSDWNVFLLRQAKLQYPEKIIYSGFDEMLLPGLLYGADGCIGTWENLLPRLYLKVWELVRAGKAEEARPLCGAFTAFLSVGWEYGIIDTFEELMRDKGFAARCFRRPSSWEPGKVPKNVLSDLLERLDELDAMAKAL
ncbi:MAG: dihydrodipicolinate synthase family protein [Clostridia bacterium]|nr:dihydrodipicolinate synthase family protein [Clostridia bacterium]